MAIPVPECCVEGAPVFIAAGVHGLFYRSASLLQKLQRFCQPYLLKVLPVAAFFIMPEQPFYRGRADAEFFSNGVYMQVDSHVFTNIFLYFMEPGYVAGKLYGICISHGCYSLKREYLQLQPAFVRAAGTGPGTFPAC